MYKVFDDYLIEPCFSSVKTREECDTSLNFLGMKLQLPVISANMDTITSPDMVAALNHFGGVGALHRFYSIEDNVAAFDKARDLTANSKLFNGHNNCIVSIGLGNNEFERALALEEAGADIFLIDVAHAASIETLNQYARLRGRLNPKAKIIVGNFASFEGYNEFTNQLRFTFGLKQPDAIKVGVGGGSMCSTRIVTGCGVPTLAAVLSFKDYLELTPPIIADGGIRNSGDICKALAAGATTVMIGGMLAGTDETPGEVIQEQRNFQIHTLKKYRGSASKSSYETQGKAASHRTHEGEETLVPYKGPVKDVLQQISAGIKSAMAYTNSFTLQEFSQNAKLIEVSNNSVTESKPHGVK